MSIKTLKIFYFDLPHAIAEHDRIINMSGGMIGYDVNKVKTLEGTLEQIQNNDYYPEFFDKITHLLYSINKNHVFFDGNKRTSLALSAYFLELKDTIIVLQNLLTKWKILWCGLPIIKLTKHC